MARRPQKHAQRLSMMPGRPISQEMARRCALIGDEIRDWPDVNDRPMFGYRAFYRGDVIFAMLPEKRALKSPTALAYKVYGGGNDRERKKWRMFESIDDRSIAQVIVMIEKAYACD